MSKVNGSQEEEPPPPTLPSAVEVRGLDRVGLRRLLAVHLTSAQVRALGGELGLEADQLPARARPGKAREMILLLEEQDRLGELRERLTWQRWAIWSIFVPTGVTWIGCSTT